MRIPRYIPFAILLISIAASAPAETNVNAMAANAAATLDARVVGYSFSIVKDGKLAASQAGGIRKAGQAFTTATQIHVASVSKTVTAIAVLQLLEANNLSVFDQVGPWLPDDWVKGYGFSGAGSLRFIDLLTHRSGVQQSVSKYVSSEPEFEGVSVNGYDGLKLLVEYGIAPDWKDTGCASKQDDGAYAPGASADPGDYFGVYCYKNANFGLFRIIIPKLWQAIEPSITGYDLLDLGTSALYSAYVKIHVWEPLGVQANCFAPDQDDLPHYYDARYPMAPPKTSWGETSMFYACGPVAWHLSSVDIAKFATYLSHPEWLPADQEILSVASRDLMDQYLLGWSSGSNGSGKEGIFWHGGDYYSSSSASVAFPLNGVTVWGDVDTSRESHACVIKFPDNVEAGLVINSSIRAGEVGESAFYNKLACGILIDAYQTAQQVDTPGGIKNPEGGRNPGGVVAPRDGDRTSADLANLERK